MIRHTSLLLVAFAALTACIEEPTVPEPPTEEQVRSVSFSIDAPSLFANRTAQNISPRSVVVTIEDGEGNQVAALRQLDLFVFGEEYISESITLPVGSYFLTAFFVLNSDDEIVFAAPVEGSDEADYVATPLPLLFEVGEEAATAVMPQVLRVDEDDSPAAYGYPAFSFDIVGDDDDDDDETEFFQLSLLALSAWDGSALEADITFTGISETGERVFTTSASSRTDGVSIRATLQESGIETYRIELQKEGHYQVVHHGAVDDLEELDEVKVVFLAPQEHMLRYTFTKPPGPVDVLDHVTAYFPKDGCRPNYMVDLAGLKATTLDMSYQLYQASNDHPIPGSQFRAESNLSGAAGTHFANDQLVKFTASVCGEVNKSTYGQAVIALELDTGAELHLQGTFQEGAGWWFCEVCPQ